MTMNAEQQKAMLDVKEQKALLAEEMNAGLDREPNAKLETIDSFISNATDRLYHNTRSAIEYMAKAEILLMQVATHEDRKITEYHQYANILILRNYLKPI